MRVPFNSAGMTPRVIDHQHVARRQKRGEIGDLSILERLAGTDDQQGARCSRGSAGCSAIRSGGRSKSKRSTLHSSLTIPLWCGKLCFWQPGEEIMLEVDQSQFVFQSDICVVHRPTGSKFSTDHFANPEENPDQVHQLGSGRKQGDPQFRLFARRCAESRQPAPFGARPRTHAASRLDIFARNRLRLRARFTLSGACRCGRQRRRLSRAAPALGVSARFRRFRRRRQPSSRTIWSGSRTGSPRLSWSMASIPSMT